GVGILSSLPVGEGARPQRPCRVCHLRPLVSPLRGKGNLPPPVRAGAILEKPAPGDRDVAGLFRTFADGASQEVIMAQSERVDVLVLGSGEAGKYLAWHMAHAGHRTAVVERQWIGGSCPHIHPLPRKDEIWSATG